MKKILFILTIATALGFFTSCTTDEVEEQTMTVVAEDTGGQSGFGQIKPPPPHPGGGG